MYKLMILLFILASSTDTLHAESPIHLPPITEWKSEWSKCTSNNDCTLIHAGCYYLKGVNSAFEEDAKKLFWGKYGDPRTLNCAPANNMTSYLDNKASCENGSCKP